MSTPAEKLKIKNREAIKPSIKAAGIIRNENNTRLWWKEGKKTGSLSIVYDNPAILKEAAAVLKGCVLIDDYEVIEANKEVVDVQLFVWKYFEYEVNGKNYAYSLRTKLDWHELNLKHADVLSIANYLIYQRCIAGKPLGKVINLFSNNKNTKYAA